MSAYDHATFDMRENVETLVCEILVQCQSFMYICLNSRLNLVLIPNSMIIEFTRSFTREDYHLFLRTYTSSFPLSPIGTLYHFVFLPSTLISSSAPTSIIPPMIFTNSLLSAPLPARCEISRFVGGLPWLSVNPLTLARILSSIASLTVWEGSLISRKTLCRFARHRSAISCPNAQFR